MNLQGKPSQNLRSASASAGDELPLCWGKDRQPMCLRVELASGELYVLPYQHFVAAHLSRANELDLLRITFSTHEVSIEGAKLRELAMAMNELSIGFIAEVPSRYRRVGDPEITTIHVTSVE